MRSLMKALFCVMLLATAGCAGDDLEGVDPVAAEDLGSGSQEMRFADGCHVVGPCTVCIYGDIWCLDCPDQPVSCTN